MFWFVVQIILFEFFEYLCFDYNFQVNRNIGRYIVKNLIFSWYYLMLKMILREIKNIIVIVKKNIFKEDCLEVIVDIEFF